MPHTHSLFSLSPLISSRSHWGRCVRTCSCLWAAVTLSPPSSPTGSQQPTETAHHQLPYPPASLQPVDSRGREGEKERRGERKGRREISREMIVIVGLCIHIGCKRKSAFTINLVLNLKWNPACYKQLVKNTTIMYSWGLLNFWGNWLLLDQ